MKVDVDLEFEKILTSINNLIDDCQIYGYQREYDKLSKLYRVVSHMYEVYPSDGYWDDDEEEPEDEEGDYCEKLY